MKKLIISAFLTGELIRVSKRNPEFGTIMVIETNKTVGNGFLNTNKRVSFVRGKLADLQALKPVAGVSINDIFKAKGFPLVKIVRRESATPSYEGQLAKINPTTKVAVLHKGQPVYMEDIVVADNEAHQDILLPTDSSPFTTVTSGVEKGDLSKAAA